MRLLQFLPDLFQLAGQFLVFRLQSGDTLLGILRLLGRTFPQFLRLRGKLLDLALVSGIQVFQIMHHIFPVEAVESGAEILGLGHGRRLLLLWEISLFSGIISHLPRKHNGKSQKHRKISPVHSQSQHRTCSNSNQSRVRSSTISQAPSSRNR